MPATDLDVFRPQARLDEPSMAFAFQVGNRFTGQKPLPDPRQRREKRRRPPALGLVEIDIARTHRQAIGFPHRGDTMDRNGHLQIGDQTFDHPQLLQILFTEKGIVGSDDIQQPADHGRDTGKMTGTIVTTQTGGKPRNGDLHGLLLPKRVEHGRIGRKDQTAGRTGQALAVDRQCPGIAIEIIGIIELGRIDKDTDDDTIGHGRRLLDQTQMAGVQIPHRRHEGNTRALTTPFMQLSP